MATFEAIATQLLFIVFPGLVIHRALAVRLLALDQAKGVEGEVREQDLLVFGLLPALAIGSEIGTVLALLGLFRTTVFVGVTAAVVIWRWRDAAATLVAIAGQGRAIWRSLAGGDLMVLVAVGFFLQTAFGLLVEAQIPSESVDVWHHQLPLAQSIVAHSGFVLPQIPNMFYGTYPIFFNILFAEGLLFVDHVIAAKVVNSLIYLGFLLTLLFCAKRGRSFAVVPLAILISPYFSPGTADALTDISRASFSALAFTFAYRYLRDGRVYFLFAAGLLAGGAVAGKYTELLTPALIGASLLPQLSTRSRQGWTAVGVFASACLVVACYPYLRNWILLENPLYPFYFGHKGLSDQYMADLYKEIYTYWIPAYRDFVTNLFTLQGWHDFFISVYQQFFSGKRYAFIAVGLIGVGLLVPRNRLIYPVVWTVALAITWFTMMFASSRWALSAYLLMLTTGFLSWTWLVDGTVATWEQAAKDWRFLSRLGLTSPDPTTLPGWLTPVNVRSGTVAALVLYFGVSTLIHVSLQGWAGFLPGWANKPQDQAVLEPGGLEAYLSRTRRGYQIYRFIAANDLKMVVQPFDIGAYYYQTAYNEGRSGSWLLPWYQLPRGPDEYDEFLRSNAVKYFIYRPSLEPLEVDLLRAERVRLAYELLRQLLPRSRRILIDPFGWELYAIDGAPAPPRP
jgi:hypothetical protein